MGAGTDNPEECQEGSSTVGIMPPKCPKCGSIIYSRRNVLCGVCGERLPEELLFTAEQRDAVDKTLRELKEREKEMHRRDAERPIDSGGVIDIGGIW
jgi:uncharacterized Zn finger protein (UPF0148 family)